MVVSIGIELLKKLRKCGNTIELGFITSEGTSEIREEAAENGASFVITKPFTPASFRMVLESVLS